MNEKKLHSIKKKSGRKTHQLKQTVITADLKTEQRRCQENKNRRSSAVLKYGSIFKSDNYFFPVFPE